MLITYTIMHDEHPELKRRSSCWKGFQLAGYLVAFLGAVITSVTLGNAVRQFEGRCPLYTELNCTVEYSPSMEKYIAGGDGSDDEWSPGSLCDFSIFVPMTSSAVAFIMAYFVLMFDTSNKIKSESKRFSYNRLTVIFFPLLLVSFIFTILMLVASVKTTKGINIFCGSLTETLKLSCYDAQFYTWKGFPSAQLFYNALLAGMITSWLSTAAYIFCIVLLVLRCACRVDFAPLTKSSLRGIISPHKRPDKTYAESRSDHHASFEPLLGPDISEPLLESDGSEKLPSSTTTAPSLKATSYEPLPGPSTSEPQFVVKSSSPSVQHPSVVVA